MISAAQQGLVKKYLKRQGLKNKDLLDEITDHYLTEIEQHMLQGKSFEEACDLCISQYKNLDVKRLNRSIFFIHHKTTFVMASFSLIFITLATMLFPSEEALPMDPPSIWPVNTSSQKITSGFGMRYSPFDKKKKLHTGVDIRGNVGDPVVAPEDGVVIEASFGEKKGNYVVIQHDEVYTTRYFHLHKFMVTKGDTVTQGDKIAEIGNTGLSKGPHLHYEVIKNGQAVNPMEYLAQ